MVSMAIRQVANILHTPSPYEKSNPSIFTNIHHSPLKFTTKNRTLQFLSIAEFSGKCNVISVPKASPTGSISPTYNDEDGVSLGTMKLPSNTDIARFETLLFQWGNSLFQGSNLPLAVPLKVDKIPGGARLGFITIGDGETEVLVYIDCLVFPATDTSPPMFRAIRNGPSKDQSAPGEPRIMQSMLDALKKCVEIARI